MLNSFVILFRQNILHHQKYYIYLSNFGSGFLVNVTAANKQLSRAKLSLKSGDHLSDPQTINMFTTRKAAKVVMSCFKQLPLNFKKLFEA